jgi:hypothetical protein
MPASVDSVCYLATLMYGGTPGIDLSPKVLPGTEHGSIPVIDHLWPRDGYYAGGS